jgi:hypothetical protein
MAQRFERPHRNKTSAVVTRADGTHYYQASRVPPLDGDPPPGAFVRNSFADLPLAQRKADEMAHPECDGKCEPWKETTPAAS